MNIGPLVDRVPILSVLTKGKTIDGIIIPDTVRGKPLKGKAAAAGYGMKGEEMVLKVDGIVLYGKYAGAEFRIENIKYLTMRQSDILAILG